jgi:hypothetical protein
MSDYQESPQNTSEKVGAEFTESDEENDPEVPPFPIHVLPSELQRLALEGSIALNTSPDMIATTSLTVCGAAIGNYAPLEIKMGWCEPCALYTLMVAPPGHAKSPSQALAVEPLITCPGQVIGTDVTVEGLCLQLQDNPNGVLIVADELMSLIGGFDKYRRGKGSDRQFYSSAWNQRTIRISRVRIVKDRRQLDYIEVTCPFLAINGCIQPDFLCDLLEARQRDDGFLDRFLMCFPESPSPQYREEGISDDVRTEYAKLVQGLFDLQSKIPAAVDVYRLSPEAHEAWISRARAHMLARSTVPEHFQGAWNKFLAYAARLALILHVSNKFPTQADNPFVGAQTVEDAFELITYFAAHGLRFYDHLQKGAMEGRLELLTSWIAERGGKATVREILTAKVAKFRSKAELMSVFERMSRSQIGRITTEKSKTGGRPSVAFKLGTK